ncbi:hypothetical protein PCANC_27536 [Puccinia coronata f. sp. avenae]|uniref:Uncharacterized protein n=1 Tax=Puccinia coronata f. sp. avenae TaxID=200324 RepID=A0A2N5TGU7_9BASI|nr:hypothetical protein PCANC_27536 [Puccinia coronata f. sp. avenae]
MCSYVMGEMFKKRTDHEMERGTDADSPAWGEEVDVLLVCESFDPGILFEVFGGFILDVMVNSEHGLAGVGYEGSANGIELGDEGGGVVVGHDMLRAEHDEVPRPDLLVLW